MPGPGVAVVCVVSVWVLGSPRCGVPWFPWFGPVWRSCCLLSCRCWLLSLLMCRFIYNYHTFAPNRCPGCQSASGNSARSYVGGCWLNCTCTVGGTLGWLCMYLLVLLRAFVVAWLPGVNLYPSSLSLFFPFLRLLLVCARLLVVRACGWVVCPSGCLRSSACPAVCLALVFCSFFLSFCLSVFGWSFLFPLALSVVFRSFSSFCGCVVCSSLSPLFSRPRAASLAVAHTGFLVVH